MARDDDRNTDRRTFLQASALATASALGVPAAASDDAPAKTASIPTRPLGKTGAQITMLDQGAVRTQNLEGIFRLAFANGIRVFDTAKVYGSEPDFKRWFERMPEVRKEIFLVTKDMPRRPSQLVGMLDQRLETLGTDYVDLFFIHGLGDDQRTTDAAINMVTSQEFKETAERIRKSGKARFLGFSTHHKNRAQIIEAAAKAGFVDAIMLQYTPWLEKDSPLNRALDVCHERGVGLISMKQIAGQFFGDRPKFDVLEEVKKRVPMLEEKNLTPFQGLLHAIWTDERISSCCVSMKNTDQIRQNTDAARRFEPLKAAELRQLRDAALAHGPMMCADCDGRCAEAAGTTAELGNLVRFLTYHQYHGERAEARRQYAALSDEARDWSGADLEAARAACPNRLDFAGLLKEVERYLA